MHSSDKVGTSGTSRARPSRDDPVGRQIRLRHRRPVGLAVDLHGAPIDGKNGGTGLDHQIGQGLHAVAAASRPITDPDECASFIARPHLQSAFIYTFDGRTSTLLSAPPRRTVLHSRRPCWQHAHWQCIKPASLRDSPHPRCRGFPGTSYVWHFVSRSRPRCPRACGAVVLAGLPRSHQPGRRHRQRAGGPRRQPQAGGSRICARSDPQERQDRVGAIAVLPSGVRRGGIVGRADRPRRRADHGARSSRGRQDHDRVEPAARAACRRTGSSCCSTCW